MENNVETKVEVSEVTVTEVKRGRGRPKGSKNKPKNTQTIDSAGTVIVNMENQ